MQEVQPSFGTAWALVHATQIYRQMAALCYVPYTETLSNDNNIVRLRFITFISTSFVATRRESFVIPIDMWHIRLLLVKIKWVWPRGAESFSSYLGEIRLPRILHWCGCLNGKFATLYLWRIYFVKQVGLSGSYLGLSWFESRQGHLLYRVIFYFPQYLHYNSGIFT
jgi:hypothetical protein